MVKKLIVLLLSVRVICASQLIDLEIQGKKATPAAASSVEDQVICLLSALRRGAKAEVEDILRSVTIADLRGVELPNRENIMHLAAHNGNRAIIDLLRNKPGYAQMMDKKNKNGETPCDILSRVEERISWSLFGDIVGAIESDVAHRMQSSLDEWDSKNIDIIRNLSPWKPLQYAITREKVNTFRIFFSKYPDQLDDTSIFLLDLDQTQKSYEFAQAVSAVAAASNAGRTSEEVDALNLAAQKILPIKLKGELVEAVERNDEHAVSDVLRVCKRIGCLRHYPISHFGARRSTVLHVAVLNNALEAFKLLLPDYSYLLHEKDGYGYTVSDLIKLSPKIDQFLRILEEHKEGVQSGASVLSSAATAEDQVCLPALQ